MKDKFGEEINPGDEFAYAPYNGTSGIIAGKVLEIKPTSMKVVLHNYYPNFLDSFRETTLKSGKGIMICKFPVALHGAFIAKGY